MPEPVDLSWAQYTILSRLRHPTLVVAASRILSGVLTPKPLAIRTGDPIGAHSLALKRGFDGHPLETQPGADHFSRCSIFLEGEIDVHRPPAQEL